jgi:hypothetical protein
MIYDVDHSLPQMKGLTNVHAVKEQNFEEDRNPAHHKRVIIVYVLNHSTNRKGMEILSIL